MVYRIHPINRCKDVSSGDVKMRACIIGAGVGGLATAIRLLQKGYKVDVYERGYLLGGRALSCKFDERYDSLLKKFEMRIRGIEPSLEELKELAKGYSMDLGFHLIGGGKNGATVRLLQEINAGVKFAGSRLGFVGERIDYPILRAGDKMAMLPRIMQLLFTRKEKIEEMKRMSVEELIEKYGRGTMNLVLRLFPRLITTVNNLQKISAGESLFAQRELMGGHPVVYPKGGLGKISEAMADYVKRNGGRIYLNARVRKIIIEDGRARGVMAEEEREYDAVIATMPVQHLFTVAKREEFPKEWVERIKNLEGTGSFISYHAMDGIDEKLLDKSFVIMEKNDSFDGGEVVGMIDFKMNYLNGVAPHGKCLVQSYVICTPQEARDANKMEELREMVERNLEKLLPGYRKRMDWCIYSSICHLDGVAKTIDNEKPGVATPVKNLYIAGDSVNSKGVGVNCAVDSSRLIMEEIKTPSLL